MALKVEDARGMLLQRMFDWPDPKNMHAASRKLVGELESELLTGLIDPSLIYELGSAIRNNLNYGEKDLFSSAVAADLSTEIPKSEKRKIEPQVAYFSYQFFTARPPNEAKSSEYYPSFEKLELLTILANLRDGRLDQDKRNNISAEMKNYYNGDQEKILGLITEILEWSV